MKLIKLTDKHYVIVDETYIKDVRPYKGKYHLEKGYIINKFPTYLTDLSECKIITHSTEPLNKEFNDWLDVRVITLQEVNELLGIVDVRKKTYEWFDKAKYSSAFIADPSSYEAGYLQALEDNKDKKYTEEQLRKLINSVLEFISHHEPEEFNDWFQNKLLKLEPKTEWEVEFDKQNKLKLI